VGDAVSDQLYRNPKYPGGPRLRAALGPDRAGLTDSDLEELFIAIWWPIGRSRPQTRFHTDCGDGGVRNPQMMRGASDIRRLYGTLDRSLAALALRQHGCWRAGK
jgi:hypothetical protein